jgi:hypothetical protein
MTILTDVDGVLLNWIDSFHDWMRKRNHIPFYRGSYELINCYRDLDKEDLDALVETFNSSAAMGFLPPLKNAVAAVKDLHENYGAVFHCITSMGDDIHAQKLRVQNLHNLFGTNAIQRVTILPCGADKTAALKEYEGTHLVWLEDHVANANVGASLGLRSYLFNREYNQKIETEENFTRIDSWGRLKSLIII